jgi:flagellar biosynthetic protein FliQ
VSAEAVVDILRQAFLAAFWVAMPLLVVGFVAGIVISLLQILTSMQDPAFAGVPRLAAFLTAILLALPWMILRLCSYAQNLWGDLGRYAR